MQGPEIYDYSTYVIFQARVHGSPPVITGFNYNSNPDEGELIDISADVTEPDGDAMTYLWEQTDPVSPVGLFENPNARATKWQAPLLYDVPVGGETFILKFTVIDIDGSVYNNAYLTVHEKNSAPVCQGIDTNPYWGVINYWASMGFYGNAMDPDGDALKYEWDFDWDDNQANFTVDEEGQSPTPYTWGQPGFFKVGMRVTESDRTNALSTYCSKDIIVEGTSMPSIKVDDSPDANPGYCDKDIDMIRYPMNNPVFHAVYCVLQSAPVMYCNTMRDPQVFGDHQVISRGPTTGGTEYPKVAGYDKFVHVVWAENDTSTVPTTYSIKINSSDDGGRTFGVMGGERMVTVVQSPDIMGESDICSGNIPGLFYLVYSVKSSGNYTLWLLVSDDGGESWHQPSGGSGQLRSVMNSTYAGMPEIEYSPDGVIHVLWEDMRNAMAEFYYDWSDDGGVTWHDDMLVANTASPLECNMAVDNVNNAYFSWTDGNGVAYFRKTTWGNPPTMSTPFGFFNLGLNNFHGSDIYVSPLADVIIIPTMYFYSGNYQTTYWYSNDYGLNLDRFLISSYSTNQTDNIVTAGRWMNNPGRMELCSIWVDSRTSLAPFHDHIWGEFMYLADRP